MSSDNPGSDQQLIFRFFNELFIIQQLAAAEFNRVMPDGLHISHFATINHLMRTGDGVTPVKIANAMQVTKATMTHTLNVLYKQGLVDIQPNPRDRRSKLVLLTETGKAFHQRAITSISTVLKAIGDEFSVSDFSSSLPLLQNLRIYLDNERHV